MGLRIGVAAERSASEHRVALAPDAIGRLRDAGAEVLMERGAGARAWLLDGDYASAGATLGTLAEVVETSDVILGVGRPPFEGLRSGQAVVGLLQPLLDPELMAKLAAQGVTAISLDGLPRTLSRAQTMDALSSQANVAGYKAVLVATEHFGRYLPLLITAAGTSKPAQVLVLGAGVAGLQAIGTARRLGAVVRGYDVRPASKGEVQSLGAQFLELTSVGSAAGEGGYARALTTEEQAAQQAELAAHIARHDIIITTAQVPGRRPPLLVTEQAIAAMKPGSVVVDMGASSLGGNVAGSEPGRVVRTLGGVTVVGAGNLPSQLPTSASMAYSRNVTALLLHLIDDGKLVIDPTDEIQAGVVITHAGRIVQEATAALLRPPEAADSPEVSTEPPPGGSTSEADPTPPANEKASES